MIRTHRPKNIIKHNPRLSLSLYFSLSLSRVWYRLCERCKLTIAARSWIFKRWRIRNGDNRFVSEVAPDSFSKIYSTGNSPITIFLLLLILLLYSSISDSVSIICMCSCWIQFVDCLILGIIFLASLPSVLMRSVNSIVVLSLVKCSMFGLGLYLCWNLTIRQFIKDELQINFSVALADGNDIKLPLKWYYVV